MNRMARGRKPRRMHFLHQIEVWFAGGAVLLPVYDKVEYVAR